jgi:DNA-binding transcriptional LysR family regulator
MAHFAVVRVRVASGSPQRISEDLEQDIGVRLIDRGKGRISLTPEGQSFLIDAKRVLHLSAEIVESVQRFNRSEISPLNIGYVANLFYDLLPVTLASFQRSFPAIPINLFDMSCGDQFRALDEDKIDLGFVGLREAIEERGFQYQPIASYDTVAAVAKTSPLAKKSVITLKELKPLFFIGMSEASYPGYRRWLTQTCRRVGFSPKVLQDADLERTLIQSVAAGLGVALLPDQVRKLPHASVVFRELDPPVKTESCIAWKANNPSPALKAYLNIMSDHGVRMR